VRELAGIVVTVGKRPFSRRQAAWQGGSARVVTDSA
jgi:hypothetical protein